MMPLVQVDDLLPVLPEAGNAVMLFYKGSYNNSFRTGNSPFADPERASHQFIIEALGRVAPGIPVAAEEFLQNIDGFAVSIPLLHKHQPLMGLIHAPVTGVTHLAERGSGAFQVGKESAQIPLASGIVDTRLSKRREESVGNRRMGSSLKLCLVADGNADLYPRLIPSIEWGTAAGSIIVEESGGRVCETLGDLMLYNREQLVNPPFYLFGNRFTENGRNWRQAFFSEAAL